MGVSGTFEETIAHASEELKALRDETGRLVDDICRNADTGIPPDPERSSDYDMACKALLARQRKTHALLAREIGRIGETIDGVAASFDLQEIPTRIERLIGYISKAAMRRRMAHRARVADRGAQLLLALGRADRLAGLIETQRDFATEQRSSAEERLVGFQKEGGEPTVSDASAGSEARGVDWVLDDGYISLETVVDMLDAAIHDHTVFLHKLTFDVEHALELYGVLADTGAVRDAFPQPEAYPHFTQSVARLVKGVLPGARLASGRQTAGLAFSERFEVN